MRKGAKKILICRFGGIGDSVILNIVARELKKKYKHCRIHFAVRSEIASLFTKDKTFDKILPTKRFPPTNIDCIQRDNGWVALESVKHNYDLVFDLKFSIERNSPEIWMHLAATDGHWRQSMSSNFVQWIDMSLAWCKIDPTTVTDKVPGFVLTDDERTWAKDRIMKKPGERVVGIHLHASSLARTWYKERELPDRLRVLYPDTKVVFFDDSRKHWLVSDKVGTKDIDTSGENGLRESAALVSQMDLLISADSGYSHIAAALDTPTLTIYTTVPSWTREMYYPNSHAIQSKLPCSPCFTLGGWCELVEKRAYDQFTAREKQIVELEKEGVALPEAARRLKTQPGALIAESQALKQKRHGLCAIEPDCMREISPEMIAERAKEILDGLEA
jgi:ADP-heptose:LPS heptosyltransferase